MSYAIYSYVAYNQVCNVNSLLWSAAEIAKLVHDETNYQ
jgi:hypothetical protein